MDGRVFQQLLDDISNCFTKRDYDLWAKNVQLPFTLVTQTGPHVCKTDAELRSEFDLFLSACDAMQLDLILRVPVSWEDCEDGTAIATYKTELLSHGLRVTEAFTSSAMMQKSTDDIWRMTAILNARGHDAWTGHNPHKSGRV